MGTFIREEMGEFALVSETARARLLELVADASHFSCRFAQNQLGDNESARSIVCNVNSGEVE